MNLGSFLALGCAVFWALSVILFRKADSGIPARSLNLVKNGVGLTFIVPTVYFFGGDLFAPLATSDLLIILLSGVIGIGIADMLYLWSLEIIGASRLAIIDCVYAPSVMFFSWLFLGEELGPWLLVGGILILGAVSLISLEKSSIDFNRRALWSGSLLCVVAIVSMSLGIVMVKPLFVRVELFQLIFLRVAAGFVVSMVSICLSPGPGYYLKGISQGKNLRMVFVASFFGTYLSMLFWVGGFKHATASLAAVLNQTTTIFTVLLAALLLNEPLSRRKILATLVATAGVAVITFFH